MAFDFPGSPVTNQAFQGWVWDGEKWLRRSDGGQVRRYAYTASAAQTVISGADLNGQTLSYTIGAVEVIVNGITLPQADFTATNGTSITLGLALAAGDYVYVLVLDSFSLLNGFVRVVNQVFTSSGTYTPSTGMVNCIIECVGGGGAGGGAASNTAYYLAGGGGGAGAYSRKVSDKNTIGASQTVTIGAGGTAGAPGANPGNNGGDTSVGSLCVAKGGTGGTGASTAVSPVAGQGGLGSGGSGDLRADGAKGTGGFYYNFPAGTGMIANGAGQGANSSYGQGGYSGSVSSTNSIVNGGNGTGFGSGGGGCVANQFAGGNGQGGTGAPGLVIITEYCGG